MPILLQELIQALPSDSPERVRKAKERFNARVRDSLRRETRLSLHRRTNQQTKDDEIVNVPILVVAGLPEPLLPLDRQSIEDKHRLSILLGPYRHTLMALRDNGATALDRLIPAMEAEPLARVLLDGRHNNIKPVGVYADFLLRKLSEFELAKFILRVNDDVLGVYRYRLHQYYDDPEPKIELYWGVIGLVARDLDVTVEDLTCVVLAHELSHAYTHVGSDAEDHSWSSDYFSKSAHDLKEGLSSVLHAFGL
jgi:hypothetical protein